jgi:hypothetical protein
MIEEEFSSDNSVLCSEDETPSKTKACADSDCSDPKPILGKRTHADISEQRLSQAFLKFHQQRRSKVFNQLNEAEQARYNEYMESFGEKIRASVETVSCRRF